MAQGHERWSASARKIFDGELDRASDDEKSTVAKEVISRSSWTSAVLTLEPVPFLDTSIYTAIQHQMVRALARLRGYLVDGDELHKILAPLRSRRYRANLAIAAAKLLDFVPVVPDILSAATAYALTTSVGEATDRYFRGGRAMSPAEMQASFDTIFKQSFEVAYKAKRDEFLALFRNSPVGRKIREGGEEVARRTAEILGRRGAR